jgi:peptide/nickel transport system substrate-binding protein
VRITWTFALGGAAAALAAQLAPSSAGAKAPDRGPVLVAVNGGTVTVDVPAVPTTLNAHTPDGANATTEDVTALVWPQVYDETPRLVPQLNTALAQAAVQSVSPLTVVYQLNPRAVWSDGVPISAADFVYAWNTQRGGAVDVDGSPDQVASTAGYRDIKSVTGSNDGRTVTVVFRTPFADWPSLFNDLLPAHVAQTVGWNTGFDRFDPAALVSGGPWQVASWDPGHRIVLTRNPRWWGSPAHVHRIVLRAVPSPAAEVHDVVTGRAQVAHPDSYTAADLAAASSEARVMSETDIGATMLQLELNTRVAPLDRVAVRQGIGHAIDRDGLVQNLVAPLMRTAWEDNDHLAPNVVRAAYDDDAGSNHAPDPVSEANLLTGAGVRADGVGTWAWQGHPLTLNLVWSSADPWSELVGPAIAAQLVSAGFDVATDPVPSSVALASVLGAGTFDLALVPVPAVAYQSQMQSAFSMSPAAGSSAALRDWSGYDSATVDALYAQAARQLNGAKAQAVYQQIDQHLWTDLPSVPLFAEPQLTVSSVNLSDVHDDAGAGILWNAATWRYLRPGPTRTASGS